MGKHRLWISPSMGMAGDMFSAALIGLGAPQKGVIQAMEIAGRQLGDVSIGVGKRQLPDGKPASQMRVKASLVDTLSTVEAPRALERALRDAGVRGGYAGFAHRALAVLCEAERKAHQVLSSGNEGTPWAPFSFIGYAHTPYSNRAPYQPKEDPSINSNEFYIEVEDFFRKGLDGLDSFSHLWVYSYLDRSQSFSLKVRPPWKKEAQSYGLFATRSPNRPNAIGMTRSRIRRIEGARIYTQTLDLFDGTPILDIKPFIQSLDGSVEDFFEGNQCGGDGWLEGSEHLDLHRRHIPHIHPGGGQLHEAQDILLDLVGAAWGLQNLAVDLEGVRCFMPVSVGGGVVDSASHGRLEIPAPATQAILDEYDIPYNGGPVEAELLTPTGASILAALSPRFLERKEIALSDVRDGAGLGTRFFGVETPNVLRLYCD